MPVKGGTATFTAPESDEWPYGSLDPGSGGAPAHGGERIAGAQFAEFGLVGNPGVSNVVKLARIVFRRGSAAHASPDGASGVRDAGSIAPSPPRTGRRTPEPRARSSRAAGGSSGHRGDHGDCTPRDGKRLRPVPIRPPVRGLARVPKQNSSGDRQRLGGISKQGNRGFPSRPADKGAAQTGRTSESNRTAAH